jgi:apoptosis-inducing factor 2
MKKVVIIGGGFAGITAARNLRRHFNVTLVDKKKSFEFTPGILRCCINEEPIEKIRFDFDKINQVKFVQEEVTKINNNSVMLGSKRVPFNYLILATGAKANDPFPNSNKAFSIDKIGENTSAIKSAKRIIVAGGGIVGIELAGELLEKYPDKNIMIVHSRKKLIPRFCEKSSELIQEKLSRKGVSFMFERRLEIINNKFYTNKKEKLEGDIAIFCTGYSPRTEIFAQRMKNEKSLVKADRFFRTKMKNVFVIGDISDINEEKSAQAAQLHGRLVAKNIRLIEKNKKPREYLSKSLPTVISIGKNDGVFIHKNVVISGYLVGKLKKIIELKTILPLRLFQ